MSPIEKALQNTEKKYQLIIENMSDLVTWQDPNGKIVYASPSVKDILGYDVDELIGVDAYELIFITDIPTVQQQVSNYIAEKSTSSFFTYRLLHKEGQYIWVETHLRPLVDENNHSIGIQSVTRDITSHKRLQQEMKRNIAKEKQLNELRATFIAMASHQFRTPLTVIRSNMELLKMLMEQADERPKKRFLKIEKRIDSQISKMTDLMSDVMLLGKLEAGKTPFLPKKQDAISWCRGLIQETYGNRIDGRKVELECKNSFLEAHFDEKIIGHALTNLISNAFKYSSESGKNPKVTVEENDGSIIFTIQDFGIGIPKEEQDNLFQSFYRANNTAAIQGTGLGLVVAKEFIEMHKGIIVFESQVGKGSTFWMRIPLLN